MIPTRVSLKNFLTFAGNDDGSPIALEFEGAALWSIAGVNGAGKSAIFDAITYALFGEHRGGRQQDNRLIRKGANTAEVTFEFLQGDRRYRVERSVTRKVGRQGQARADAKHVQASIWDETEEAWIALPDTDKATELERWVRALLGMGPETFASSVLLRQGEADKLLDAKANQRFRILAGLIDLRAYQRLEQLANDRRKAADNAVDAIDQQLGDIPDITDEELSGVAEELAAAETAAKTADEQRTEADRRRLGAKRHADLRLRDDSLRTQRDALAATVEQAELIRAAATERGRIDTIIEPVTSAFDDLAAAATAARQATEAAGELGAIDLDDLDEAAKARIDEHRKLEAEVEALTERHDLLVALRSSATDVLRCRRDHAERLAALAAIGDPPNLRTAAEQLETELTAAQGHRGQLDDQRSKAVGREGSAKGVVQTALERQAQLDDLSQAPTCSRCNQPITPQHLAAERKLAQDALDQAQATLDAETTALQSLMLEIGQAKKSVEDLDRRHRAAVAAADGADTAHREVVRTQTQLGAATKAAATVAAPDDVTGELMARVTTAPISQAEPALPDLIVLERTTRTAIATTKRARDNARNAAQLVQQTLDEAQQKCANLERTISLQEERAMQLRAQADLRLQTVPPDVAAAVRGGDPTILEQLEERREALRDALDDLIRLERAELELTSVLAAIVEIDKELGQIPAEHQIPIDEARSLFDAAEQAWSEAQASRDAARDQHQRVKEAHTARRRLAKKLAASRGQVRVAKKLTGLLGKTELQGRLLTEATAGVEAYANDTLARISGGTLELDLRRDDDGDAANLDIFVQDRSSADEPLEVAFISGSQKFRVAVALAAGLGQYVGGAAAIRSLIIDEGFGSLDADGRQRMIEELRALSEHLDRIIVVSHQDDFTDRTLFPSGFVLRKEGTRTTVERVG